MTAPDDSPAFSDDEAFRRRLYEVRANSELSLVEKLDQLLSLGCEYLDVENGHIKRIDTQQGIHDVIASVGEMGGSIQVGDQHAHATTFCRRTIELDSPLAISDASEQGWQEDPAYQEHGLECYLGATVTVEGTTYGTVCFVSRTTHPQEFSVSERAFVELTAGIVGTELSAKRHEYKLAERDRLNAVLNRVLRHNLRNSMNVVGGYAELLVDRLDGEDKDLAKRIETTADDLTELGETARKLGNVANESHTPTQRDIVPLISDVVTDLEEIENESQIDVELPNSQPVVAIECLESALYELGENALIHTDGGSTVTIRVGSESYPDDWVVVEIEDEGSGLPEIEQNILRGQMETQLDHGQGLGLWFVYWTVTRSNGRLTVSVNDGTTVRVWLHSEEAQEDELQRYLSLPNGNGRFHVDSLSGD